VKEPSRWHRRLGAYGICRQDGDLLLIDKVQGPYTGLFDLPGGGVEDDESLSAAVCREVEEETGLRVKVETHIGAGEVLVPWPDGQYTHLHQIAVFYLVRVTGGKLGEIAAFDGQDAGGASWVQSSACNLLNASPLVMQATKWLETGRLPKALEEWDDSSKGKG
jgi:ADP-ribose pyrophosphatase YjhB (NUDIX family)